MRPFGELEHDIMRVIWRRTEPTSVAEIVEALDRPRRLAHTTVITVAERLREKGWLTRQRQGRAYLYAASVTPAEYSANLMNQALDAAADRPAALLRFAGKLDPQEAAALRAALAESETNSPGTEA